MLELQNDIEAEEAMFKYVSALVLLWHRLTVKGQLFVRLTKYGPGFGTTE